MAAENLTSIFAVYDSVIFVAGVAVGFTGNRGVQFMTESMAAIRGTRKKPSENSTEEKQE